METKGYVYIPKEEPRKVSVLAMCMNCDHTWKHSFVTDSPAIANSTAFAYCSQCYDAKSGDVTAGRAKGQNIKGVYGI